MLLALPTAGERAAFLPDCFTPPPEEPAGPASAGTGAAAAAVAAPAASSAGAGGAAGSAGSGVGASSSGSVSSSSAVSGETGAAGASDSEDLLWCTPSQMLTEIDARLKALAGGASAGAGATAAAAANGRLLALPGGLSGQEYQKALNDLREVVSAILYAGLDKH